MRFLPTLPLLLALPAICAMPDLAPQRFQRDISQAKPGTLVIVEDAKGEWKKTITERLQGDDLLEYQLRWWTIHPVKEASVLAYARERFHWSTDQPRWAFVGPDFSVLCEGQTLPTAQELKTKLENAGVKTPKAVLLDFLRLHPDHLEAQVHLLTIRFSIAGLLTARKLKLPAEDTAASISPPESEAPPKETPLLDPEADLKIWQETATQLQQFLASGDCFRIWFYFDSRMPKHSPIMRAVCMNGLPLIEEELQRAPEDWISWHLWLACSEIAGGRSLVALLDSLTPGPWVSPLGWPPGAVMENYLKDAKARKDWASIRDLLEPHMANLRLSEQNKTKVLFVQEGKDPVDWSSKNTWDTLVGPLLEAYLRLGDTTSADQIVNEAVGLLGYGDMAGMATKLAQRCGQAALATRWQGLAPARR